MYHRVGKLRSVSVPHFGRIDIFLATVVVALLKRSSHRGWQLLLWGVELLLCWSRRIEIWLELMLLLWRRHAESPVLAMVVGNRYLRRSDAETIVLATEVLDTLLGRCDNELPVLARHVA